MNCKKVAVLGAGSWGIAIANLLFRNGHAITIWEFDPEACNSLKATRKLPSKLPGISLEVPSQNLRSVIHDIADMKVDKKPIFVNLAKGIEVGSLKRMSEVIEEELPEELRSGVCTVSGPSHAEEVAREMPTAVTAASENIRVAEAVQQLFITPNFRIYTSTDLMGVELAGSLKNVIALAAGMLDGLGMGDNTRGALLTRGLAEIVRLGLVMGAYAMTFSGLAGIGDLVTTCLSKHSRNRFVGEQVGRGRKLKEVLTKMPMVAEGVQTTRSAYALADKYDAEMPITTEVHRVLFENKPPEKAINDLMTRDPKSERWR
jgi:glycerol-3-phosphate dehydrogenase (NAD(P)+)